jgi:predicted RNase H-like HicB family nuclease
MQATNLQKFTVYYRKEDSGGYSGRCLELPAAISQGKTLEELKKNMTEAILLVLEYIEDKKKKEENKNNIITLEVPVQ